VAGAKGRSGGPRPNSGGARPGAGRPRNPPPKAPAPPKTDPFIGVLREAQDYAEAGAEESTILAVLGARHGFDEAKLKAEGRLAVFRRTIAVGLEICRADLLLEIKRRGVRSKKNAGSVNILALRARNLAGWDRQGIEDEQKPDLTGARERLRFLLEKLARNKTAELHREVTPEEVLLQDLYTPEAGA